MTKEAIRKREYRANKEPKEIADKRRAKDNEAKKKKNDMKTDVQKKAMNEANKLNMRAKRDSKKLTNTQNEALEEFQRIQTPPRALTIENQNLSVGRRHDGTLSSGSSGLNDNSLSEYEKIRLQNIEESKKKFQELFGTKPFGGGPSVQKQKRSLFKSATDSETSDEEIVPTENPIRKQPKRQCKSFVNEVSESSDSSFEAFVDDLVEASAAELEVDPHMIVTPIVNNIINSIFGPKQRKQNIGRKSKRALKSSKYRQFHETDDQYQSRLKKSSVLKQDNLKNEEPSIRKRRLFKLKQTRYVKIKMQFETNSDNIHFYILGSSKAKVQGQNDCPRRLNTLEKSDQKKMNGPKTNVKPLMLKITGQHVTTIQQWRSIWNMIL